MKDIDEAKTIIRWEITQKLSVGTLKIDQKGYIQDLFESKEMTSCYPTVLLVKACFSFFLDQSKDLKKADMIVY